jgi:hypothetical protein
MKPFIGSATGSRLQNDSASRQVNPDALALLGNRPLFRTDQGGTIHFWTDGRNLWTVQES